MGTNEIDHLVKRLQQDGEKTLAYFAGLGPDDWRAQVYTTGSGWRVHDILAHFVSAERSFFLLVENVAGGGDGAPRDLDINEFNEAEVPKLEAISPDELQAAYREARQASGRLAAGLDPADLDRVGYHPWFGQVTVRHMLKLVYRHNMIHLRDVRKALAQGAPVPHREFEPPTASGA
ncbi:MAG TPA: DinB family protein [Anaerolineales bacterium]|jgi:uncharacterized protein (TIGR03083 family)